MTHAPLDALHTPTGRIVQVCTTCETDDGDWVLWPCAVVRQAAEKVASSALTCDNGDVLADKRTAPAGALTPVDSGASPLTRSD